MGTLKRPGHAPWLAQARDVSLASAWLWWLPACTAGAPHVHARCSCATVPGTKHVGPGIVAEMARAAHLTQHENRIKFFVGCTKLARLACQLLPSVSALSRAPHASMHSERAYLGLCGRTADLLMHSFV